MPRFAMRSSLTVKSLRWPRPASPALALAMRYLTAGMVVFAPTLICMALIVIFLRPHDAPQVASGSAWAMAPIHPAPSAMPRFPATTLPVASGIAAAGDSPSVSPSAGAGEAVESVLVTEAPPSEEEIAAVEERALSQEQDQGTRGESLVMLTRLDPSRAYFAMGGMLASVDVNDRLTAVGLLHDWRLRSGDPDGSIAGLLQQAERDGDAGVAYQAHVALNPPEHESESAQTY